jgi:serine protease Do
MFDRCIIPIFLTITTALVSIQQVNAAYETRAVSSRAVADIARKTVVKIEASNGGFGSGVIIGRSEKGTKNIYTILTAAHVIRTPGVNYSIITPIVLNQKGKLQRKRIRVITNDAIKILPNVDLALVSFESNYVFAIGTIGNSAYADAGSPVYVAGFPKPGKVTRKIKLQFTGGMISSGTDESDIEGEAQQYNNKYDPQERNGGYDLAYTSVTREGMSGGPVFDVAGRIIAIHGKGDRNMSLPQVEGSGLFPDGEKTGFNYGIPIQTFLDLQPQASRLMGIRLNFAPLNYELSDGSGVAGTKHRKFNKKLRTRGVGNTTVVDITKVNEQIAVDDEISN